MDEHERVRKVVNWLIYNNVVSNERELAELLGYTKSSFSQIMNARVPLSDKFVSKLCQQDKNINKVWVIKGVGEMFITDDNVDKISDDIRIPVSAWEVIQAQAKSLSCKDEQMDELISMLKEQIKSTNIK